MQTKTRYVPQGFIKYSPEIGDYPNLFEVYLDLEKLTAIFYSKKQSTHTWFNRFRTVEDMKKKINDTISSLMSWEDKKVERKEARKAPHSLKVGDILYSSWGYDQTNINFYQVLKLVSDRTVQIREIHSRIVEGGNGPSQYVEAVKDSFIEPFNGSKRGEVLTKRVSATNDIKLSSYEYAGLWDGKPRYETAMGWGH